MSLGPDHAALRGTEALRAEAERVLSDPRLCAETVVAALQARRVLHAASPDGLTPDGDGAIMVARNALDAPLVAADLRQVDWGATA